MEAVSIAAPYADVTLSCPWDSIGVYEAGHTKQDSAVGTSMQSKEYEIVVEETEDEPSEDVFPPTTSDQSNIPFMYTGNTTPKTNVSKVTPRTSIGTAQTQNTATYSSNTTGRKGLTKFIEKEINLRTQKVQDSIDQQKKLHNIRLQIEHEQLQTGIAARKKAEAEAELAVLKLKLFKEQNQMK